MTLANGAVDGARAPSAAAPGESSRLKVLLVAMASACLALGAIFGRHGLLEVRQYRLERSRLQAEIVELQTRNAAMEQQIKALRTDPVAMERIAREELGLARPGEKLILLAPPQRHDEPLTSTTPGLDGVQGRP